MWCAGTSPITVPQDTDKPLAWRRCVGPCDHNQVSCDPNAPRRPTALRLRPVRHRLGAHRALPCRHRIRGWAVLPTRSLARIPRRHAVRASDRVRVATILPHDFTVTWSAAHEHFTALQWRIRAWSNTAGSRATRVRRGQESRRRQTPRAHRHHRRLDCRRRHPADVQDRVAFPTLLRKAKRIVPTIAHVWVDKGYTGHTVTAAAASAGVTVDVVSGPKPGHGFVVQPRRWVVERTNAGSTIADASTLLRGHPRRSPSSFLSQMALLLDDSTAASCSTRFRTSRPPQRYWVGSGPLANHGCATAPRVLARFVCHTQLTPAERCDAALKREEDSGGADQ